MVMNSKMMELRGDTLWGRREMHTWVGKLNEEDSWQGEGMNGQITLNWMLEIHDWM
jgi:hypothetical protein